MSEKKDFMYIFAVTITALIIGIATICFIGQYVVCAEEVDELDGWIEVYSWTSTYIDNSGKQDTEEVIEYMKYTDFHSSEMCLVKNSDGSLTFYSPENKTIEGKFLATKSYGYVKGTTWKHDHSMRGSNYLFNALYIFESEEDASSYVAGELPATSALNYDEVQTVLQEIEEQMQKDKKVYDATIPIPSKVYFSSLGASGVTGVWSYESSVFNECEYELYYEVKLEHFYSTASFVEKIFSKEKTTYNNFKKTANESINDLGQVVPQYSVQNYADNHVSGSVYNGLLSDTSDKGVKEISGLMSVTNTIVSVPQEFSLNLNFQYLYVGSQLSVTPYYIDENNVKQYGKTVVSRKFTADDLDSILGATNTVIATDDSGEQYSESQTKVDDDGNYYDNVLTTDNVTEYIKNGFGLAGSDGYIELSRRFFIGIPSFIWALIAMALSVNILVLLFKIIRGF